MPASIQGSRPVSYGLGVLVLHAMLAGQVLDRPVNGGARQVPKSCYENKHFFRPSEGGSTGKTNFNHPPMSLKPKYILSRRRT